MKYVFWQNILSLHQSSFIRNLSAVHDVTLVVEKGLNEDRLKQGWSLPDFGNAKIIIKPNEICISDLLNDNDNVHVFTGINSIELVHKAFLKAVKKKLKIGVQLEPFNWLGLKGKLRFLKYFILRVKYNRYINFILAIGDRGKWCYEKTGFPKDKIYDWAYFTEEPKIEKKSKNMLPKPVGLFVGSIDANKNILPLINILKKNSFLFEQFIVIGKGPLEENLKIQIEGSNIVYKGVVSNAEVLEYMAKSDFLVLPSLYDGWGAVINESLNVGTPVICSSNCGASVLIKVNRGTIFSIEENNLEQVLNNFLRKIPYSSSESESITNWAKRNISGKVASEYFIDVINHVYANNEVPQAPWLK